MPDDSPPAGHPFCKGALGSEHIAFLLAQDKPTPPDRFARNALRPSVRPGPCPKTGQTVQKQPAVNDLAAAGPAPRLQAVPLSRQKCIEFLLQNKFVLHLALFGLHISSASFKIPFFQQVSLDSPPWHTSCLASCDRSGRRPRFGSRNVFKEKGVGHEVAQDNSYRQRGDSHPCFHDGNSRNPRAGSRS